MVSQDCREMADMREHFDDVFRPPLSNSGVGNRSSDLCRISGATFTVVSVWLSPFNDVPNAKWNNSGSSTFIVHGTVVSVCT